MSVHREVSKAGAVSYRVKWRAGGRPASKSFAVAKFGTGKRADERARSAAGAWDLRVKEQLLTTGVVVQRRGAALLRDSWMEWFQAGSTRWTDNTQETYASMLDVHILPRLGQLQLAAIKPATVEKWIGELQRDGVGPSAVQKSVTVLSSLMAHAVRADAIDTNPVHAAPKPHAPRERTPVKITPLQVEQLRRWFIDNGHQGDAVLISLLAYAGPRPESEAIVLDWLQVGTKHLTIKPNLKRGAKERRVDLLAPLRDDLAAWRKSSGRVGGLVLPFGAGGVSGFGTEWRTTDWDRWRGGWLTDKRTKARTARGRWTKACAAVGLPEHAVPRDLRGSFASLLIWEGRSVIDVARQLGHKPSMCLDVYSGEFEDFDPINRRPAVDVIRDARAQVFSGGLKVVRGA